MRTASPEKVDFDGKFKTQQKAIVDSKLDSNKKSKPNPDIQEKQIDTQQETEKTQTPHPEKKPFDTQEKTKESSQFPNQNTHEHTKAIQHSIHYTEETFARLKKHSKSRNEIGTVESNRTNTLGLGEDSNSNFRSWNPLRIFGALQLGEVEGPARVRGCVRVWRGWEGGPRKRGVCWAAAGARPGLRERCFGEVVWGEKMINLGKKQTNKEQKQVKHK